MSDLSLIYFKLKLFLSGLDLSYKEFEKIVDLIVLHYYKGELDKNKLKEFKELLNKLKFKTEFPDKLYRGLYFKDGNDFDKFLQDMDKKEIKNKNELISWSEDIKVACDYATNFKNCRKNDISVLIEVDKKYFKNNFIFSLYYYLKTIGYNNFFKYVYEYSTIMDKRILKEIELNNDKFVESPVVLNALNYIRKEKEIVTEKIKFNDGVKLYYVFFENDEYNLISFCKKEFKKIKTKQNLYNSIKKE